METVEVGMVELTGGEEDETTVELDSAVSDGVTDRDVGEGDRDDKEVKVGKGVKEGDCDWTEDELETDENRDDDGS